MQTAEENLWLAIGVRREKIRHLVEILGFGKTEIREPIVVVGSNGKRTPDRATRHSNPGVNTILRCEISGPRSVDADDHVKKRESSWKMTPTRR